MKKLRIYLETTVFNYYFDTERDGHADTVRMFEAIGAGKYEGYTSEYVTAELLRATEPKQSEMVELIAKYGIAVLNADDEANKLAGLYVESGIIPAKYFFDGAHIAVASINGLDCILSFNYQHINKLKTKRMTENVNLTVGYKGVTICTPMEVLDDEKS